MFAESYFQSSISGTSLVRYESIGTTPRSRLPTEIRPTLTVNNKPTPSDVQETCGLPAALSDIPQTRDLSEESRVTENNCIGDLPAGSVEMPTDGPTGKPADRRTYRPEDRPTYRPADRPTYRPADRPTVVDVEEEALLADDKESEFQQQITKEEEGSKIPTTVDADTASSAFNTSTFMGYNSFWKYKKYPKGPKSEKFNITVAAPQDPHMPIVFSDPVCNQANKRFRLLSGTTMRLGEGNDMTPNPHNLLNLGSKIDAVNEMISRSGSNQRKRKILLSSRLCRIKRSSNHEANKIILDGLKKEREELSSIISTIGRSLQIEKPPGNAGSFTELYTTVVEEGYRTVVAGRCAEYVDHILDKCTVISLTQTSI